MIICVRHSGGRHEGAIALYCRCFLENLSKDSMDAFAYDLRRSKDGIEYADVNLPNWDDYLLVVFRS
jgi:hypothetical protein